VLNKKGVLRVESVEELDSSGSFDPDVNVEMHDMPTVFIGDAENA